MDPVISMQLSAKRRRDERNVCFICQCETSETLVAQPKNNSYNNSTESMLKRAKCGDEKSVDLLDRNSELTTGTLINAGVLWHKSCYKIITLKRDIAEIEKSYDQRMLKKPNKSIEIFKVPFTRTQTQLYDKDKCFFCDEDPKRGSILHKVATDNSGEHLHQAMSSYGDDKLKVRLSAVMNPSDAHAIDVKYHAICWSKHVTNVLRKCSSSEDHSEREAACVP